MRRDALNVREHLPHLRTPPNNALELRALHHLVLGTSQSVSATCAIQEPAYPFAQCRKCNRLVEIVSSALANCLHSCISCVMSGHQDNVNSRIELSNALQNFESA